MMIIATGGNTETLVASVALPVCKPQYWNQFISASLFMDCTNTIFAIQFLRNRYAPLVHAVSHKVG